MASSSSSFPFITSLVENLKCQYNSDEGNKKNTKQINLSCDSLLGTDYFNHYNALEFDSLAFGHHVNILSNAIINHERLERVDLCWDFLQFTCNKEPKHALFRAISSIPNLKHLHVFYGDSELQLSELETLLFHTRHQKQLEVLELNAAVLTGTEKEFERFCDKLISNFQHSLKMIKLEDAILPSEKSLNPLIQTLSELQELENIELVQTQFDDPGISKESMHILCQMPKLTNLKLEAPELATKTITGIAEALSGYSQSTSSLKSLFLSGGNLDHCSALAIANTLQKPTCLLESLHLYFESSDSILEYSDNESSSDSSRYECTAFEKALRKNSSLKELAFNGCTFSDTVVSKILQENSTLKSLSLTNAKIQEGSCTEIANALCNGENVSIEHLCLANNNLGEDSGLAIANALKKNSTLKSLEFSNNDVGETAWIAIADSLRINQTLEVLNIDNGCWFWNGSDDQIYSNITNSFIDALQQNYIIKEISTQGMDVKNKLSDKLDFYLNLNSSDRRRKFFENSDMDQQHWLNHVITSQTTANLSELHYFFRSMPAMFQELNSNKQQQQQQKRKQILSTSEESNIRVTKRIKLI